MPKLSLALLFALLLGFNHRTIAAENLADTPANRLAQADRYLAAAPPQDLFAKVTKSITMSVPEGPQRDQMIKMLTSGIDMGALEKAMKESLVKHFTADELRALADFYGSPLGKSAMSKMGDYTADLMPIIQAQVMKSMGAAAGSGPSPDGK